MSKYDVAAFVWPSYTGDELRSRIFWKEGIGEWQTVRDAKAKFEGHDWPRKPLWGFVNEADPQVMEMEIEEATRHGVNVFIYDWYWYDGRPFLENCLNDGFLKAKNNKDMRFYIMWANHDANHLWCRDLSDSACGNTVIWRGGVGLEEFRNVYRRICDTYFPLENYYRIDGCPVFMIYETATFVNGLGGLENAAAAIAEFRAYAKSCGYPDVHIQLTGRKKDIKNLSGIDTGAPVTDFEKTAKALAANSFTHYQFVHFTGIDRDYCEILADVQAYWREIDEKIALPYFPHVSCGWDNNPRFHNFRPGIVKNNTPENFEKALRAAKQYADAHPDRAPLITINSWNEWTETSYLQPDDLYGYGYLDAVRKVFLEEDDT